MRVIKSIFITCLVFLFFFQFAYPAVALPNQICSDMGCTQKPSTIHKHIHEEGPVHCDLLMVSVWDADYENAPIWDPTIQRWVFKEANWKKIAGEESTRYPTKKECPNATEIPKSTAEPTLSSVPPNKGEKMDETRKDATYDQWRAITAVTALSILGGYFLTASIYARLRNPMLLDSPPIEVSPGWKQWGANSDRWWDGTQWTDSYRDIETKENQ